MDTANTKSYRSRYYASHREEHDAATAAWRKANPAKCRAMDKAWRKANPEKAKAKDKRSRDAHREQRNTQNKKWLKANAEHRRTQQAKWRADNAERIRARKSAYRKRNRAKETAALADWHRRNPDRDPVYKAVRRARKRGAVVGNRKAYLALVKWSRTAPSVRCYWCNEITSPKERHLDHIIPLSKGGAHAVGNLCVSCPTCNCSKHDKMPEEFTGQGELKLA